MQLEELIKSLALSELGTSKLFVDKPRDPEALYELTKKSRASLINHINDATMAICTKLPLYKYSTVIRLVEGKNTYHLHSKHSIRNMPEDVEIPEEMVLGDEGAYYYIYDTDDYPFEDNLLNIHEVTSMSGMYSISIGDDSYINAIYTPRPNVIELPEDMVRNQEYVTLGYTGHIPRIPVDAKEGDDYQVDMPYMLIEAISAFICHRIQLQPQDPNNASISMSHMDRFNTICGEYVRQNIGNLSGNTSMRVFNKGGWV